MADDGKRDVRHVEEVAIDQLPAETEVKAVYSVALADALAKDRHSPWTASMFQLYAIMAFVTLSMKTFYGYRRRIILTKKR